MNQHDLIKRIVELEKQVGLLSQTNKPGKFKQLLKSIMENKFLYISLGICLILMPFAVYAAVSDKPFSFSAGDIISSSEVNQNFDYLYERSLNLDEDTGGLKTPDILRVGSLKTDSIFYADGTIQNSADVGSAGNVTNPGDVFIQADTDDNNSGAIRFQMGSSGIDDKLYIDNNGNIGIGNITPSTILDVAGTVNATAFTGDGAGLTNVGWANLSGVPVDIANGELWLENGSDIYFNAGNVGIGTTNPGTVLSVGTDGATPGRIELVGDAESGRVTYNTAGASSNNLALDNPLGTPRLVIDDTGNVGIGTTSPGATLDVDGAINSSNMVCREGCGTVVDVAGGTINGGWYAETYCPASYYVCGLQQLVEPDQGGGIDDTAVNDIRMLCCPF